MTSIIFLRHGQAENNTAKVLSGRSPGVKLTENGIMQAKQAAELVSKMNVSQIYTSPIERAQNTAKIVGEHNSIPVTTDDRLIELDMGKFTGLKYGEVAATHGNVSLKFYSGDLELAHNGVETFDMVKKRVLDMVNYVRTEHSEQNVLLVTHMDPIKVMLSTIMDLKPKALAELIVANAALTVFGDHPEGMSVKAINIMDTSRLDQQW